VFSPASKVNFRPARHQSRRLELALERRGDRFIAPRPAKRNFAAPTDINSAEGKDLCSLTSDILTWWNSG